jgi:hypothetical protein
MLTTAYGESVICTPNCAIGEPNGPMLNGTTYIVRPAIDPANRPRRIPIIVRGSIQLFVGPASSSLRAQMNVRSSTRATSLGSLRARKLRGRFSGFKRMKAPDSTSCSHSSSYSDCEPSHQ